MTDKPDKPRIAFQIDAEECSIIVYAKTNAQARREGADELNTDWEYVTCRRAAVWDALAPHGPTDEEKFETGWWFECAECTGRVFKEDGGVWRDGEAFCDRHADPYVWREPPEPYRYGHTYPYTWVSVR